MSEGDTGDQIDQVLDEMKSEHEQLFQTVDRIRDALGVEDVNLAKQHLMQLEMIQQAHFEHEVALMEQHEYPHIEDHKKNHDGLIGALHSINRLIHIENLQRLNGELVDYLEDSMAHVIEVDRPFQEFLLASCGGDA